MSELNFCSAGGALVGPDRLVGPQPFDYAWPLADIAIGCNALVCRECGAQVRSAPGYEPGATYKAHFSEIYPAADWEALVASGVLLHRSSYRFYVCRCIDHFETLQRPIEDADSWDIESPPPWRCAGHPRFALPGELDGIAISATTDFDALSERALSESLQRNVPATALFGDQWLSRLYHLIAHDPLGAQLSSAVLKHVGSADPKIRVNAIDFFRRNPRAPGADGLLGLGRDHYDWFAGVANPNSPDTDMLYFLLQALACRVDEGDRAPLPFLHDELLKPGPKPGYLITALRRHDEDWITQNRNAILSANLQLSSLL